MNRLATECQRLFLPTPAPDAAPPADPVQALVDAQGRVRAAVLEVARPADWQALSAVWRGVQADLGLPEPAVAVNGRDGLQLWFSLAQPVPLAQARAWLDGLRRRYLGELPLARVGLLPQPPAPGEAPQWGQAAAVLRQQPEGDCWAAFVAPDLAAVFADTPWLDLPPGAEGQAELLSRMRPMPQAAFTALLAEWRPAAPPPPASPPPAVGDAAPAADLAAPEQARQFLLRVMHDDGVAMALRIEAAKALLVAPGAP